MRYTGLVFSNYQPHNVLYFHLMSRSNPAIPLIFHASYGIHLLDHLAADRTGLAAGQVTVVTVLQVDADLMRCVFTSKI